MDKMPLLLPDLTKWKLLCYKISLSLFYSEFVFFNACLIFAPTNNFVVILTPYCLLFFFSEFDVSGSLAVCVESFKRIIFLIN